MHEKVLIFNNKINAWHNQKFSFSVSFLCFFWVTNVFFMLPLEASDRSAVWDDYHRQRDTFYSLIIAGNIAPVEEYLKVYPEAITSSHYLYLPPLESALASKSVDMVKYLLAKGASASCSQEALRQNPALRNNIALVYDAIPLGVLVRTKRAVTPGEKYQDQLTYAYCRFLHGGKNNERGDAMAVMRTIFRNAFVGAYHHSLAQKQAQYQGQVKPLCFRVQALLGHITHADLDCICPLENQRVLLDYISAKTESLPDPVGCSCLIS